MKNRLLLLSCLFMMFFLLGAKDASEQGGGTEVMKELDDFQKALSGWMKNLDNVGSQFGLLQKSVGESLTPLKEFDKSVKGIEEKLNTIMSRVESMEKSASIVEVKNMLDSFNKTFDVLKKLLSDLTKRVEDQEVKTTVLEKRYQEAQRPLEPIKKAIEDVSKTVNDKLSEQEKRFATIEDSVKTRIASSDTAMKTLDERLKTISDLESRMKRLEKGGAVVPGTATVETPPVVQQPKVLVATETAKVETDTTTVTAEAVKERVSTPEEEGFKEIGDGFYIRNVNLFLFGSSSQVKGEIKNLSDKDWSIAAFVIRVYNANGLLLFNQDFSIKTFKKDEIRSFNEIISGYSPLDIARYEIEPKRRY